MSTKPSETARGAGSLPLTASRLGSYPPDASSSSPRELDPAGFASAVAGPYAFRLAENFYAEHARFLQLDFRHSQVTPPTF